MKNFLFALNTTCSLLLTTGILANLPMEDGQLFKSNNTPSIARSLTTPPQESNPPKEIKHATKSSFTAVALSMLYPGLGHLYLDEYLTALGLGATYTTSLLLALEGPESLRLTSSVILQNTWFYSPYAVYRDVRIYNRQKGYRFPMPKDSLYDLVKAPVQPNVICKPAVWGGTLGFLSAGALLFALTESSESKLTLSSTSECINPLLALPIAIGEETFFRGYLQPLLEEVSSATPAIIFSSLAFGAAHIPNANEYSGKEKQQYYIIAVPFITAFGGYLGWLTHKTNSLKYGTAIHAWYDFIIFAGVALSESKTPTRKPGKRPSFSYSFAF